MQTQKTITVPAIEEYTKVVITFGCDFCDHRNNSGSNFIECYSCCKMVCRKYVNSCVWNDPHEIGDYPDKYCPFCYKLKYVKYKEEYNKIELDYEKKIEALDARVKKESLEQYELPTIP